jgi:uncharacterized RDD family membrane protein YckC
MSYCVKCGKLLGDDVYFCPACGTPVAGRTPSQGSTFSQPFAAAPVSGIDALTKDQMVQGYWLRRLASFIIDAIVVGLVFWILAAVLVLPSVIGGFLSGNTISIASIFGASAYSFFESVVLVLYFAFTESLYGVTLGKSILDLKVATLDGRPLTLEQALIRNVSKIYWVLLLLDVVIGLATQAEYRQKFSDKYARTVVLDR